MKVAMLAVCLLVGVNAQKPKAKTKPSKIPIKESVDRFTGFGKYSTDFELTDGLNCHAEYWLEKEDTNERISLHLVLAVDVNKWDFSQYGSRMFRAIADKQQLALGYGFYSKKTPHEITYYLHDEAIVTLSKAKKVECRIGAKEFVLSQEAKDNLAAIYAHYRKTKYKHRQRD